ncbi:NAD-dependent epimerase/dehydratase family protein [Rhizobium sp. BT03]|uniref:NAD-dependent epimerase/dehydratase family protein n=1 Tax=Rhizobium sp. BT03 TaxID=3045156 RepID=UPI0024B3CD35|nr:NAD-dependent epimerase/dehydratase family protein [Rhizobium sp. BT03]WHO76815.1 NAD-dependent epimerase/dehydratase family protein [Rhizobium sp. BT03]
MHALVTGGAGFIGSHLCDRLLDSGYRVTAIDNLHLGRMRNIDHLMGRSDFRFQKLDMLDREGMDQLVAADRPDAVFHLAANSDIAAGNANAELDLQLNQLTTTTLLAIMRKYEIGRLFFASTSAVFGEAEGNIHENHGPLRPISLYGASKLAAEAYLSVYALSFGIKTLVLRFPNVVGERSTHGAIYDFINRLKADPTRLQVLGNGRQTKPYLYVGDLVDAILLAWDKAPSAYEVFHASGIGETSVRDIAEIVVSKVAAGAAIEYGSEDRGWLGDVPRFSYDISRLVTLGWSPKRKSTEAVELAVERILANGF